MKILFWIGLAVLVLGVISLLVAVPHTEHEGVSAGGMSIRIQTQHSERVSPFVSCALLLGGVGMVIAGRSALRA
ncbi:MAG: hypothetical protein ACRD3E_00015 [Terriglobales bacterium]